MSISRYLCYADIFVALIRLYSVGVREVKGCLSFANHLVENLLLKYLTIKFDVLGEGPAIKYIEISWRD